MPKTYIDKLAYIHLINRKVLTTLSHGKDTWYIPGGKILENGNGSDSAEIKYLDIDDLASGQIQKVFESIIKKFQASF